MVPAGCSFIIIHHCGKQLTGSTLRFSIRYCISQTFFVSLSTSKAQPCLLEYCKQGCLVKETKALKNRPFGI